jgi:hypothetical protein
MVNVPGRHSHEKYREEDEAECAQYEEEQISRGAVGEEQARDRSKEEGTETKGRQGECSGRAVVVRPVQSSFVC